MDRNFINPSGRFPQEIPLPAAANNTCSIFIYKYLYFIPFLIFVLCLFECSLYLFPPCWVCVFVCSFQRLSFSSSTQFSPYPCFSFSAPSLVSLFVFLSPSLAYSFNLFLYFTLTLSLTDSHSLSPSFPIFVSLPPSHSLSLSSSLSFPVSLFLSLLLSVSLSSFSFSASLLLSLSFSQCLFLLLSVSLFLSLFLSVYFSSSLSGSLALSRCLSTDPVLGVFVSGRWRGLSVRH